MHEVTLNRQKNVNLMPNFSVSELIIIIKKCLSLFRLLLFFNKTAYLFIKLNSYNIPFSIYNLKKKLISAILKRH